MLCLGGATLQPRAQPNMLQDLWCQLTKEPTLACSFRSFMGFNSLCQAFYPARSMLGKWSCSAYIVGGHYLPNLLQKVLHHSVRALPFCKNLDVIAINAFLTPQPQIFIRNFQELLLLLLLHLSRELETLEDIFDGKLGRHGERAGTNHMDWTLNYSPPKYHFWLVTKSRCE